MNTFKKEKLAVCFSGTGKQQTAFDEPLDAAEIDTRHPQTSPTFPTIERTREQTRGCSGEYIVIEEIKSEIMRLRYGFKPSAHLLALWSSLAYGVALAPVGVPANNVQTITRAGGDPFVASFAFEGLEGSTPSLPANTTAAAFKAQLERLDSIKPGQIASVTGTLAAGLVVTFGGALEKSALPLIEVDAAVVVHTTPGANKKHEILRSALEAMNLTSLLVGFAGDSTSADIYKNVAVNSVSCAVPKQGDASAEIELIGSAKTIEAIGATLPGCVRVVPIKARDCRVSVNGEFYTKKLAEMRWTYSNNIATDDDAFDWDALDVSNLERGNRTTTFGFTHYGSKGDALYNLGHAEEVVELAMHFGKPGDRFSWFADRAKLRTDALTTFIGSKGRSAIPISGEAFEDEETGEVDRIVANIAQTSAFLLT